MHCFSLVCINLGFPGGSVVKNLPANTGDMGLACEIPWTEELGGLQFMGS